MPRFEPFRGLRYDTSRVDLATVTAPPYDVIDDDQRAALAAGSVHNAVRVDLPVDEDGVDRYTVARRLLEQWQADGILVTDATPSLYGYRMTYPDEEGRPRHTTGVIGALELSPPGDTILPHEHTTPKAKSDRLALLQACRANLSAVWGLTPAAGLSSRCAGGEPIASWIDIDGVEHALTRIADPAQIEAITALVATAPVVIADGHHRYETSLAYRDERRAASGDRPGPYDLAMAYVVELIDDELNVRAIHRLIGALPDGFDLPGALEPFFELRPTDVPDEHVGRRMIAAGALCLVVRGGRSWLMVPRPGAMAGTRDLDSSRLDVALAALPPHELSFQHGWDNVLRAVEKGEADAGVLLRPATVAQIAATARGGERMPPKTTFFHPKPKTGLVFRPLDG